MGAEVFDATTVSTNRFVLNKYRAHSQVLPQILDTGYKKMQIMVLETVGMYVYYVFYNLHLCLLSIQ